MDAHRFDRLTRTLSGSRRQILFTVILSAFTMAPEEDVEAGPGCKDVGKKCKKAKSCCSGVCKGKKGKKRCKAHDSGGCQAGQIQGTCGGTDVACTTSAGQPGLCNTTTGNAGYCGTGGDCFSCTKDADCREVCGPGAACVLCEGGCDVGTVCHGLSSCFGP